MDEQPEARRRARQARNRPSRIDAASEPSNDAGPARVSDSCERNVHEPLLALRNACFHPGNVGDAPNLPGLIEALRKAGQRGLADRLNKNWSLRSLSNDVTRCALWWIHAVGRYELITLGRWWPTTT